MGLFPRHLHARHLIHLLPGHLHPGHGLIFGSWTALVPLLLLFGSLRQDLATFLCKIIDSQRVVKGWYGGLRR